MVKIYIGDLVFTDIGKYNEWKYNLRLKACEEYIAKYSDKSSPYYRDDLVILYDIENNWPYVATKQYQQGLIDLWEATKPKLSEEDMAKIPGRIFVFGTGGSTEDNKEIEKLFYNPETWKTKDE